MSHHYRNPHDRDSEPKDWRRWNVGEEDGSREMKPRGKSIAYKNGYNAGVYHRLLDKDFGASEQVSAKGRSR